ncbi:hypothetical protein PBI_SCTP2_214 [Salicola phage SCTP-2]|nr:hypothetical protein PBI_SCTP2_214 [Salicola phage SCTP-2]
MKIKQLFESKNKLSKDEINEVMDIIQDTKFYNINKQNMINGKNLYHGTDKDVGIYALHDITDREKPRDTEPTIHNIVNELSEKEFGSKIRSKLFVSSTPARANIYGEFEYVIIPLYDYTIYYSDQIDDFYNDKDNVLDFKELYKDIYYKITKYIKKSTSKTKYKLNQYLTHNVNDIISNLSNDSSFRKFYIPFHSNHYSRAIKGEQSSYNTIKQSISKGMYNHLFKPNISDSKNDTILYSYVEDLIIEIMDDEQNNIIEFIKSYFYTNIKENYIDTIKSTQNVNDIYLYSECMLDTKETLFINRFAFDDVVDEIKRREGYES